MHRKKKPPLTALADALFMGCVYLAIVPGVVCDACASLRGRFSRYLARLQDVR
jgi:hypothetical protein